LSNLDAKLREQMRVELKRLQRRTGITFVYVTHDQAEALALSDQIAVIHGGRLQQYGTPQDVYARPANRVVADFMGLVNLLPAKVIAPGTLEVGGRLTLQAALPDGIKPGDSVEVSIRPENIHLNAVGNGAPATITERTFLGNISEYYASLDSGPTLRVQTHPGQVFAVGDKVAVGVDATQCSVFRSSAP
jgi:ABC-type Fe3+/spermidine/putrescine transport system ATPase subunit